MSVRVDLGDKAWEPTEHDLESLRSLLQHPGWVRIQALGSLFIEGTKSLLETCPISDVECNRSKILFLRDFLAAAERLGGKKEPR